MNIKSRIRRHRQVRRMVVGTSIQPRLAVFRSSKHIYVQIIDDSKGDTLVSQTDASLNKIPKKQKAYEVGKQLAQKALKKKIKEVRFDRGGFEYHGRIAEVARGAREGGLRF